MNLISLISHAREPSQFNISTITYNDGKPETIVEGEAEGLRMRRETETVHYRDDEASPHCAKCGRLAEVWHGSLDHWEAHPMRCEWADNTTNSSPASTPSLANVLSPLLGQTHIGRGWRR